MRDQRVHERYPFEVEVEVTIPGFFRRRRRILRTRDMSHGGVFLVADGRACPKEGTEIEIRLTGLVDGQAPPVVRAKVVRVTEEGMAIAFLAEPKKP